MAKNSQLQTLQTLTSATIYFIFFENSFLRRLYLQCPAVPRVVAFCLVSDRLQFKVNWFWGADTGTQIWNFGHRAIGYLMQNLRGARPMRLLVSSFLKTEAKFGPLVERL